MVIVCRFSHESNFIDHDVSTALCMVFFSTLAAAVYVRHRAINDKVAFVRQTIKEPYHTLNYDEHVSF